VSGVINNRRRFVNKLAEETLLDHRMNKNKVYLLTSAVEQEGVTFVSEILAHQLGRLHTGDVFLFKTPKSDKSTSNGDQMRIDFFDKLRQQYSIILIDAGAMLTTTSAIPFFDIIDSVVLIVKAGSTRKTLILEMQEKIKRLNLNILGIFLNGQRRRIPGWLYKLIT